MKIDFLRSIAVSVAGKNAGLVTDILFDKKNVNEFLVAKKLGLTINQTRNILYKLSDEGLVSFVRKKDKKKGWYTYFWTFNTEKALSLLQKNLLKDIDSLEHQLKSREVKRFYFCKSCNSEVTEENALLHNFTCPECGEVYELNDNRKAISEINSSINRLKRELDEINSELAIIGTAKVKKIEKTRKKEEKDKKEKRKKAQLERRKSAKPAKKKPNSKKAKAVKHSNVAKKKAAQKSKKRI